MGAKLTGQDGFAFFGNRLEISGGLSLQDIVAGGEVRMVGARIHGQVLLSRGAKIEHEGESAVTMDGVAIRASLVAAGVEITGKMRLIEATIDGQIVMPDAVLRHPSGTALSADGVTASGLYAERLRSEGEVRLTGARITSDIVLDGSELSNPLQARVQRRQPGGGHEHLLPSVRSDRRYPADGARIGGGLVFEHARIPQPGQLRPRCQRSQCRAAPRLLDRRRDRGRCPVDVGARRPRAGGRRRDVLQPGKAVADEARTREFVDFEWPQVPARRPWYRRWSDNRLRPSSARTRRG